MAIRPRTRSIILSESLGVCARCMKDVGADGEVAHIVAETCDGPRGDDPLPIEDRNKPENLIYLCVACHREEVDKYPEKYPVHLLRDIKHKLQQMRKKFNEGYVDYFHALFHGVSPERLSSTFYRACQGRQIQLSYDDQNNLILFKKNIDATLLPVLLVNEIEAIRDSITFIMDAFDRDGEEFQSSPDELKMRVIFYNENDPETFHRRDEFWSLYEKVEAACTRAVESIRAIVEANHQTMGST